MDLPGDGILTATIDGENTKISLRSTQFRNGLDLRKIREAFQSRKLDDRQFPLRVKALRQWAALPRVRKRYAEGWIFIDRDMQADDNGEHLYRWVRRNHPQINAFFVLRKSSRDWDRLKKEGFRLLEFGG